MLPQLGFIAGATFGAGVCIGVARIVVADIRAGAVKTSRGLYRRRQSASMFWALILAQSVAALLFGIAAIACLAKLYSLGMPA